MTNRIIESLISGALTAKGVSTFSKERTAYFITYYGGAVGVYAEDPGVTLYSYMEYSVGKNNAITQSHKTPVGFNLTSSINSFFDSIFNHNFSIANKVLDDESNEVKEIDDRYITELYWYNPKSFNKLELMDLSKYALKKDDKNKLAVSKQFYDKASSLLAIGEDRKKLIKDVKEFVDHLAISTQRSGQSNWTTSGMLALNLTDNLPSDSSIMSSYNSMVQKCKDLSITTIPTLNEIFASAIKGGTWSLAREVDLSISPFLYLYPSGDGIPKTAQAVPPSDKSVSLNKM